MYTPIKHNCGMNVVCQFSISAMEHVFATLDGIFLFKSTSFFFFFRSVSKKESLYSEGHCSKIEEKFKRLSEIASSNQ